MDALASLPGWSLPILAVLLVVQLSLQVWALVDLHRLPSARVAGGRKVVWVLVIVLLEIVGPLVYFSAGRKPAEAASQGARAGAPDAAERAVDVLYGDRERARDSE